MITLIKMKYKEWKLKLALYTVIEAVIKEHEDIFMTIANVYSSVKDTPVQELQDMLITAIAELANNQIDKERETEKNKAE